MIVDNNNWKFLLVNLEFCWQTLPVGKSSGSTYFPFTKVIWASFHSPDWDFQSCTCTSITLYKVPFIHIEVWPHLISTSGPRRAFQLPVAHEIELKACTRCLWLPLYGPCMISQHVEIRLIYGLLKSPDLYELAFKISMLFLQISDCYQ